MAHGLSTEGGYGIGASTDHVDASHADRIDIPDAELLFPGHFARSGPDLVLTGQDGHRIVVTGYFTTEKHPDLVAPNGAHLNGDLVDLLAGSPTPGQYAQARTTLPPDAIGKVEKVVGQVTLIHNGVAGPLHVGDLVYKTDVVQTGANSTCGIAFPDGTALNLVNNTRMALNEYNYEPNSASNGALFSLVEGTFAFVAGQVAHTGEGMKINTPVATMGIRGTAGLLRSEPTVINSNLGHVWSVFLHEDIDGSHHLGRIALIDQDPTSPTFDQVFYLLDSSEYIAYLEPHGAGQPPHVRLEPISSSKVFGDRHFYHDLSQILTAYQNGQNVPQSVPGMPGSGDNPNQLIPPPQPQESGGDPRFIDFVPLQGSSGDLFTQPTFPGVNSPVMPGQSPNQQNEAARPEIVLTAPTETLVIHQGTTISGVSVTETGATSGEIFTVTVSDTHGILSANTSAAGGGAINGSTNGSGTSLIITGTLSQVNAVLATLTDNDNTPGPDTITVTAIDSLGHGATPVTINVSVTGAPSIAVTTPQTIGVSQTDAITGVVISEVGATATETFTVELKDSTGLLSATGATPASDGTHDLIITGTLSQVNAVLATLTDKDNTPGPDNITVSVTDGFGNAATPATIGVTINGAPVITVPGAQTFDVNETTAITGVSVSESGSTSSEIFTATVSDTHGILSANTAGGGGTITSTNSGHTLTIVGTLSQVYSDLGTLTDTNGTAGSDPITVKATDSFGNAATQQTIAVTVNQQNEAPEPPTLTVGGTTATLIIGASTLPSITVTPVDSDDWLTVTIAGLPMGATITDSADGKVFSGSSFTLTEVEAESELTLSDGSDTGPFTLTVTASNTFPGEAASSRSQTVNVINGVGPAGVAGSPINLALANSSAANGEPVAVTITGGPSDWTLNEGTNLGNGSWTVQTSDLSAPTVLTAAAYAGAMVLNVTESWTNADGSIGTAKIADNVEAYAPGMPIFALAGNDTLTRAGANDLFVFAQPIGNDTIYNFNAATDKINLIGFTNVASFSDLSIAADGSGDAVITDGRGETITLHGINAASLTAADFVFNQKPTIENAGSMVVSDGDVLPLSGTISNTGTIAFDSTGDQTELQIIGDGVTLQGGGRVTLSGDAVIVVTSAASTLINVDNTICGAGRIGAGDGALTLINETHGAVDANVPGGTLILDTGVTITNDGVLEATNGGTLQICDPVTGSGSAIVQGGTLVFEAQSNMSVTFNNGPNGTTYGELVLREGLGFFCQISGFSGTAPDLAHSDAIDLESMNYNSSGFSESYNAATGALSVTDGSHLATLIFDNFGGTFSFASDGHGGVLITDPPAVSPSSSISIGGPGHDTFVFHPDMGTETLSNFNPQNDTIELDHFANVQSVQQLSSLITTDPHGEAFIDLGHSDGIAIPGVTASYLQAHLQSLVHLH